LLVLFVGFILNLFIIFEFTSNTYDTRFIQFEKFNLSSFLENNLNPFNDYKEYFENTEYLLLKIFQYIKIIFSDLTYILIIIIVDSKLFLSVKKKMKNKHNLGVDNNHTTQNNNNNRGMLKKLTSEERISRMIILNGFNWFVFRFPIALLSIYIFIYRFDKKNQKHLPDLVSYTVCKRYKLCDSLGHVFYFFYLISYFIQFLIFFKLDKNFRDGFENMKNVCKKKFSWQKNSTPSIQNEVQ